MRRKYKHAWVDRKNRVIAFHEIPGAEHIKEVEENFWKNIMAMVSTGYSVT